MFIGHKNSHWSSWDCANKEDNNDGKQQDK